jgi:hypothetical protein
MNIYPPLTISLLSQLTNRELQSNYLNHLDRTVEIATLLTQITNPDLALRIVNLAFEVDLFLGASLTGSLVEPLGTRIDPELQKVIVDRIDSLEIPTRLKIELWRKTKSKAALSYIHSLFVVKNQYRRKSIYDYDFECYSTVSNAMDAIIDIDPKVAAGLLIENLDNNGFYSRSLDRLAEIAITDVDADAPTLTELTKAAVIDDLVSQLDTSPTDDYYNYDCPALDALAKIGTESVIDSHLAPIHRN